MRIVRAGTAGVVLLAAMAAGVATAPAAMAAQQEIASSGPLTRIIISDLLNCQVARQGDSQFEFFPGGQEIGACTTQIRVGDTTYGPDQIPAGNNPTPFTAVSQSAVTGTGSDSDPFRITTVVAVGDTGLRLTEVDTYSPGRESYRTDVTVTNDGQSSLSGIIYRAGDCFLQDSDSGFGRGPAGSQGEVSCVGINDAGDGPGDRIEQFFPLTDGSSYIEDSFRTVWDLVAAGQPFPNTSEDDVRQDNGAGLSWLFSLAAGQSATYSNLLLFSPEGRGALSMTKTADDSSVPAGSQDGYDIVITNPNNTAATLDSVTDRLPAGFTYREGTTTGAAEPMVTGQDLVFAGPLTVPANGTLTISFGVTVSSTPGSYDNSAEADGGNDSVAGTGPTATIEVTDGQPEPVIAEAPVAVLLPLVAAGLLAVLVRRRILST